MYTEQVALNRCLKTKLKILPSTPEQKPQTHFDFSGARLNALVLGPIPVLHPVNMSDCSANRCLLRVVILCMSILFLNQLENTV